MRPIALKNRPKRLLADGHTTARTHSRGDCPHVDQIDLVVETWQSSVDIAEFKLAIVGYVGLVQSHRSQVYADDSDMGELPSHGHSPEKK